MIFFFFFSFLMNFWLVALFCLWLITAHKIPTNAPWHKEITQINEKKSNKPHIAPLYRWISTRFPECPVATAPGHSSQTAFMVPEHWQGLPLPSFLSLPILVIKKESKINGRRLFHMDSNGRRVRVYVGEWVCGRQIIPNGKKFTLPGHRRPSWRPSSSCSCWSCCR